MASDFLPIKKTVFDLRCEKVRCDGCGFIALYEMRHYRKIWAINSSIVVRYVGTPASARARSMAPLLICRARGPGVKPKRRSKFSAELAIDIFSKKYSNNGSDRKKFAFDRFSHRTDINRRKHAHISCESKRLATPFRAHLFSSLSWKHMYRLHIWWFFFAVMRQLSRASHRHYLIHKTYYYLSAIRAGLYRRNDLLCNRIDWGVFTQI